MYNLYQSKIRKDINTLVYQKPSFSINMFGKDYFGIIKEKSIFGLKFYWLQILGVELPNKSSQVREEIKKIKKKHGKKFSNIFLQFGVLNEIIAFENHSHRSKEFKQDMKQMRLNIREYITKKYDLKISFRENMPQANIIYDITQSDQELLSQMNSGCKERVKKAIKKGVEFEVAKHDYYNEFYDKRVELAGHKGFNIIPKNQFTKLTNYIKQNNCGDLFISKLDGEIMAGSICLYDQHRIIYLYGFGNSANKKFRNIGGHHFLKFKIFAYAREKGLTYCDMLGGAPTGFDNHPLAGVSKFKESLGGIKIEQYGSYDIVLNKFLYNLFKLYFKLRK